MHDRAFRSRGNTWFAQYSIIVNCEFVYRSNLIMTIYVYGALKVSVCPPARDERSAGDQREGQWNHSCWLTIYMFELQVFQ